MSKLPPLPIASSRRRAKSLRRRLAWWLAIGGLLVLAVLAYREFWLARPAGAGPAGPDVPSEAFAASWTDRPVLLLGIGDSVTAGLGADRPEHSYFQRLAHNPPDEWDELRGVCLSAVLPNLSTRNIALSGSTSLYHIDVIRELETQPEDLFGIVVMTTGGNDLIHNYGRTPPREGAMYGATVQQAQPWIDNFQARLDEMLDLLNEKFPAGCLVFLADIYDPTDGVGDAPSVFLPDWPDGLAIHAAYNDVIRRSAVERDNVHLVPIHQAFLGHGSHCRQFWRSTYRREDPHYWYHYNVEDPNDRGYDALRRLFLLELIKVKEQMAGE